MKTSQHPFPNASTLSEREREIAFQRYINALESGDDAIVDAILQLTEADFALCERIGAANDALAAELAPQLAPNVAGDAPLVEDLARRHFSLAFETPAPRVLTFGDVARELHSKREIPTADAELSARFSDDQTPLPARVSLPELRALGSALQARLGFVAGESERFWREFHRAAVRLRKRHGAAARAGNWGALQAGLAREEQPRRAAMNPAQAEESGMPELDPKIDMDWIDARISWLWEQCELDAATYTQSGSWVVPLSELARALSIDIQEITDLTYSRAAQFLASEFEIELPLNGVERYRELAGFIHADAEATIILIKRNDQIARHHVARRRFTIAHELGHFVLHFCPLWEQDDAVPRVFVEGAHLPGDGKEDDETQLSSDLLAVVGAGKTHEQIEAEANAFAARLLMPERAVRAQFEQWAPRLSSKRSILARRFSGDFLVSAPAMRRRLDDLELGENDFDTNRNRRKL